MREKYNLIQELQKKAKELKGDAKLSLIGQGDFAGANNVMRGTMNIKHHTQHLAIDNPEFPFVFDGKENVTGENSSYYLKTNKEYKIIDICKKYENRLKGHCYVALYFLYCKDDNSYKLVERDEVENLTENFGFSYNNTFLDQAEKGDVIPPGTVVRSSSSYDQYGNVGMGVNGRILYAVHPAVQDDAIIVSESFAKRMVTNNVQMKTARINTDTIMLNLYGKDGEYRGLPNVGDKITNGIVMATRVIKESRMFSDMRDVSLRNINMQSDTVIYGEGEVVDINVYCNNPDLKPNKINSQLLEYYYDEKWFYSEVYKACKKITDSGSPNIDREIYRWKRLAMNHLDTEAIWSYNDNVFSNMMVEILMRKRDQAKVGRKITGRHGNKTVICSIWPDDEMPYLTTEYEKDKYGVVHAKGIRERCDLITNPLAIVNRTIPMVMFEGSITFILDRTRKYALTLGDYKEQKDFMFDVLRILNPIQTKELDKIYDGLSEYAKKKFVKDCISISSNGLLITSNGLYVRWEAFNDKWTLRDAIIKVYQKYGDIIKPYHVFVPKPKWGRDIYIGDDYVGYQYMMMLKQSGEKGFSVRSASAISDEGLPDKSAGNKASKEWHSSKPIRFGEYETPNFMIVTDPNDFALFSALYRTSVDGRRWLYEAVLSDDGKYNIPDKFTSRSADIFQVYMKSLGIRVETIIDDDEYIAENDKNNEIIAYQVGNTTITCTMDQKYYLSKIYKIYRRYLKDNPNTIDNIDDVWDYITDHLTFKKKHLTKEIKDIFFTNINAFSTAGNVKK